MALTIALRLIYPMYAARSLHLILTRDLKFVPDGSNPPISGTKLSGKDLGSRKCALCHWAKSRAHNISKIKSQTSSDTPARQSSLNFLSSQNELG
ncbi:hypothetical protein CEXT_96801 [Caerostris extrusa]|uniref:Uncharacterized protein n=1 Tax=Caerostris extrusa TaxID=172846 RepID=A0AAV4NRC4_CAEEX|nr:hypothetical protein CEXT_96801 [Caerostris extrusa]